ncbi:MAG: tetratricopeptide repeat protein [Nitrospirae bacterium]|nr:tetratricopeptide repeat protein [Nitrospirota bacterium]
MLKTLLRIIAFLLFFLQALLAYSEKQDDWTEKCRKTILDSKGEYDTAIEYCSKAIELNPRSADAYAYRGIVLKNKADSIKYKDKEDTTVKEYFDKAIDDFTKSLELDSNNSNTFVQRASVYERIGLYNKGIHDYTRAIELNPKDTWNYRYRGDCYRILGIYDKAIVDYTKAIELAKKASSHIDAAVASGAYFSRGLSYFNKELYDKSIDDFSKAIEIYAEEKYVINVTEYISYVSVHRGDAYAKKGLYEKAIKDYTHSITLNQNNADAYFGRSQAYLKTGLEQLALEDIKIYNKLLTKDH